MADVELAQALVGLPVAVVVIAISFMAWRALSAGKLVLGREHDAVVKDRDFWRQTALQALNVSEAAVARRIDP